MIFGATGKRSSRVVRARTGYRLVVVPRHIQTAADIADKADLRDEFLRELLLDLEVVLLDVGRAHVWVHREHGADRIVRDGLEIQHRNRIEALCDAPRGCTELVDIRRDDGPERQLPVTPHVDALAVAGVIEHAVAAAQDGAAAELIRKAKARAEVVLVGVMPVAASVLNPAIRSLPVTTSKFVWRSATSVSGVSSS